MEDSAVGKAIDAPREVLYPAAALPGLAVGWAFYRGRARLVPAPDAGEAVWRPDFPGVEAPPPGSGTRVVRPLPGWPSMVFVAVALLVFVAALLGSAGQGW